MLRNIMDKAELKMIEFSCWLRKERGDTNFISIIIILAIVLTVAGAFIALKDELLNKVNQGIKSFTVGTTPH